jgi:hypothetical protein
MTAISRTKVDLYIVAVDTNASSLTSTDVIKGEIKSYAKSGGEREVESDPVFGGFVDKEKPIAQIELSFDIIPSMEYGDRWAQIAYSLDAATGVYTMAGDIVKKAVFIAAADTVGSTYVSWGFNNCNVTLLDMEHNADDNQTNTLTLKFSPTNEEDVSNFMTAASEITLMPNWTDLDNNI